MTEGEVMSEPTTEAARAFVADDSFGNAGTPEARRRIALAIEQEARANADRELRELLGALVKKIDHVHDSDAYRSHWMAGHVHVGPYPGPTYTDELMAARKALAASERKS